MKTSECFLSQKKKKNHFQVEDFILIYNVHLYTNEVYRHVIYNIKMIVCKYIIYRMGKGSERPGTHKVIVCPYLDESVVR